MKTLLVLAMILLPGVARAQDRDLLTLFHPDRLVERMAASLVTVARSQADLRYSDLSVSLADGVATLDDLEVTLWDNVTGGAPCDLAAADVELRSVDPLGARRVGLRVALRGIEVEASCLPPEARPALALLGLGATVEVPDATVDLSYDVPSGAAEVLVSASAAGVAAATLEASFDYASIWVGDREEPTLSGDLRHAAVIVEDLGGWTRVAPILPPGLVNPDTAAEAATSMLGDMLTGTEGAEAFATAAGRGWAAFVADPGRLVLETDLPPGEVALLDDEAFADPGDLLPMLRPVVRTMPVAEAMAVPRDLVGRALSDPATLSMAERRLVGLALLSGEGAPRAVGAAVEVLSSLSGSGDGAVDRAMAEALAGSDPEAAYASALQAGGSGVPGLRSLLDGIEADLPFATRLRLQGGAAGALDGDVAGAPTRELRARAEAHLSGVAAPRSLRHALFYASLAAARGDRGAERLLSRIDASIPADGMDVWRPVRAEAEAAALTAWLAR